MPLYEFECPKCGTTHSDIVHLGTDTSTCPECGSVAEKVMSVPNFVLKGNVWAKDNYGLKKKSKRN